MRDSNPSPLHAAIVLLSQLTADRIHAADSNELLQQTLPKAAQRSTCIRSAA
jgi:hypothetical protein